MNIRQDLHIEQARRLAPAGHFIGLHIRFATPLVTHEAYPEEWVRLYTEKGWVLHDPTIAWGLREIGVVRWSSLANLDGKGILRLAANYGLRFGLTCTCGSAASRSMGSFARQDREFTDEEISDIKRIMQRLHDMTQPAEELSHAQLEALRYIANGDRQAEAARKIGISVSALKARLVSARQNLAARTTAEAIQRARDSGLF